MKQTETNQIKKIPPLTRAETIDFYVTGRMPDRFEKTDSARRHAILRQHGVDDKFVMSTGE